MSGIRDKVAIIGMGCSKFGERFESNLEDLLIEAFEEAVEDAGITRDDLQAAWYGNAVAELGAGLSGTPASIALGLPNIPVTRVENMCATGTEALRGAAYAVASGACDIALAIGGEKLKDTGFGGLPDFSMGPRNDLYWPEISAPGAFAQLASAYRAKHGLSAADLKQAMGHVSWKSHQNGAKNAKAHLQRAVDMDVILHAPIIAEPLGLFDCCGVSDGAACAILARPEIARELASSHETVTIKSLQVANSNGREAAHDSWDGAHLVTTRIAATRAYEEAGISDPRSELSLMEVHDCFSVTELVTMEDLHISRPGNATKDVLDGFYDLDGPLPCQSDGGLKCFGHPIGASGLRMAYEIYNQLQDRSQARQVGNASLGLTHNLGGLPHQNVAAVAIFGRLGE